MTTLPKLGLYKHYKGHLYELIAIGIYSEDPSQLFCVYKALYESEGYPFGQIWIRPLEMFCENVIIDDKEVPRFEYISEILN